MRSSALATAILWFLPTALQSLVAFVMFRRRLVRQFPVFFTFNVLVPARDVTLYFLPQSGNRYATVSWWGAAAAIVLALGIVFETSWHFIRPYPYPETLSESAVDRRGHRGRCGPGHAALDQGASGNRCSSRWIILTERSARFLQVCLLTVAIALMSRLGLTWQNYSVGIAAGCGVYAALDLVLLELRAHLHAVTDSAFVLMRSAAYNPGVAIWSFYFLPPHSGKPVGGLPGTDLANWNDALTEHIDKWYRR